MATPVLLAYCRAGFEKECAQEIAALAGRDGVAGHLRARPDAGFLAFHPDDPAGASAWLARQSPFEQVFARQVLPASGLLANLPPGGRLGPIVEAARALGVTAYGDVVLESPDTNEGRALAALLRPLRPHLLRALREAGVRIEEGGDAPRLHVFFVGSTACHVAIGRPGVASTWPQGIPRVRVRGRSPSRSGHKLAEAFLALVGQAPAVVPGAVAVDLGAAPGGWTSQLLALGYSVVAVDNGPLDAALLDTGRVTHRREDGFRFRPAQPVEWMVCDIVESPARVARLAADWLREGWCRQAIFNLKLPMKRRWEAVEQARHDIGERLAATPHRLRLKQLYHDREEVTAWLAAR